MNTQGHNILHVEVRDAAKIKDLVCRFRVCWEVYPERVVVDHKIRDIGFSLELYGTHEPGVGHVSPGCMHCHRVQRALTEIANWILPREERESWYEIVHDWESLIYSHQRADRPDVCLTIRILHKGEWDQPVNACELHCLSDMEHMLSELGACKGAWTYGGTERNDYGKG